MRTQTRANGNGQIVPRGTISKAPRILNSALTQVALDKLKPHPRNPRQGDVGAIHESITENGFYGALVVQKSTGYILAGNHRWKAAKEAGLKRLPVLYVDVDDDRALRILLADNRTNDLAAYDEPALAAMLKGILAETDTLAGTGYDADALDALLRDCDMGGLVQEDEAPPLPKTARSKRGEIYALGEHRLMCGDATSAEDVGALMGGEKADVCLTDPPYGVGLEYNSYDDTEEAIKNLAQKWLPLAINVSTVVCFTPGTNSCFIYPRPSWILCWFYGGGPSPCPWGFSCWQPILVYGKDPSLTKGHGNRPDAVNLNVSANAKEIEHPCPKPLKLWAWLIQRLSMSNEDLFLDMFGGSGSTLIACEQLSRRCRMVEIDPLYCDVIRRRWWKLKNNGEEAGWEKSTPLYKHREAA